MAMTCITGGTTKPKPDYGEIYRKAIVRTLDAWELKPGDKDLRSKLIYYGVRYCNHSRYDKKDYESVVSRLELIQDINAMIGRLSPAELMQMFPVRKIYNGERYQTKDFFYTMAALQKHGLDNPIGNAVFDTLWDYQNIDTELFLVGYMGVMSDIRKLQGGKGLMEEWCEKQDIPVYYESADRQGRTFMTNSKTGKTKRVHKKPPRYLRLVQKEACGNASKQ